MEIKRKKNHGRRNFWNRNGAFVTKSLSLCEAHAGEFEEIGYGLDVEFGQKEDESQRSYADLVREEGKRYDAGYVSRALVTVRRAKTEDELAQDERIAEENRLAMEAAQDGEQAEQLENDETLRISEDALRARRRLHGSHARALLQIFLDRMDQHLRRSLRYGKRSFRVSRLFTRTVSPPRQGGAAVCFPGGIRAAGQNRCRIRRVFGGFFILSLEFTIRH